MKASILIMAGGKSSRMDYQDKANLSYHGQSFLTGIAKRLKPYTEQLMISEGKMTHRDYHEEVKEALFVKDIYEDCGPMGGLHAALLQCKEDYLYVVACDMPKMEIYLYQYLMEFDKEKYDAIIPTWNGNMQPLAGIYKKRILNQVTEQMESGDNTMKHLLRNLSVCLVEIGENKLLSEMLENINTMEEYKELMDNE